MSSGIIVDIKDLRSCFEDLRPLFGKGDKLLPILVKVSKDVLTICCTAGCVYVDKIQLPQNVDKGGEITVLYRNILDFIPKSGKLTLSIEPYGLIVKGDDVNIKLPVGYSLITEPARKLVGFEKVDTFGYVKGLSDLLNVGLPSLYKKEKPVQVYKQLSVLRYPNVAVQVRTPGLPVNVSLTQDFVKLFIKFRPTEIYYNGSDAVVLKRDTAYLEIPAESLNESNTFLNLMNNLGNAITLDIEHYADKLRNLNLLGNNIRAKLTFFSAGVKCSVEHDNITIETNLGDCSGVPNYVCYLPMALYYNLIKVMGNTKIEFLYGDQKLCLRNQAIVIVAHAVN